MEDKNIEKIIRKLPKEDAKKVIEYIEEIEEDRDQAHYDAMGDDL